MSYKFQIMHKTHKTLLGMTLTRIELPECTAKRYTTLT